MWELCKAGLIALVPSLGIVGWMVFGLYLEKRYAYRECYAFFLMGAAIAAMCLDILVLDTLGII